MFNVSISRHYVLAKYHSHPTSRHALRYWNLVPFQKEIRAGVSWIGCSVLMVSRRFCYCFGDRLLRHARPVWLFPRRCHRSTTLAASIVSRCGADLSVWYAGGLADELSAMAGGDTPRCGETMTQITEAVYIAGWRHAAHISTVSARHINTLQSHLFIITDVW